MASLLAGVPFFTGAQVDETVDALRELLPDRDIRVVDEVEGVAGSMVRCLVKDEGRTVGGCTGLTVAEGVVLVPLAPLLFGEAIEVTAACCDSRIAEGIIAFDAAAGLALVSVRGIEAKTWRAGYASLPAPGNDVVSCVLLTPFRVEGGEGTIWQDASVLEETPAGRQSRRLRLDLAYNVFGSGGVLVNENGMPVGMTIAWAGAGRTEAGPIAAFLGEHLPANRAALFPSSELLDRASSDADRSTLLTMRLTAAGRAHPDAQEWVARAVELDDTNARAWYELGVQHGRRGEGEDSIRCLARSVELDSGFVESWYSLGIERLKAGLYDEAIPALTAAIDLDAEYAEPRAMLGACYLKTDRPEEALRWMKSAHSLDPESALFVKNLEHALRQTGREDEIHDVWRRHAEAVPDDPTARRWHVYWLLKADLHRTALTEAELAVDRFEDDAQLWGYLALSQAVTGYGDAEASARRSLELDPDNPTARYVLEQFE